MFSQLHAFLGFFLSIHGAEKTQRKITSLPYLVIINYRVNQNEKATQPHLIRNLERNHSLFPPTVAFPLLLGRGRVIRKYHFLTAWTGKSQN